MSMGRVVSSAGLSPTSVSTERALRHACGSSSASSEACSSSTRASRSYERRRRPWSRGDETRMMTLMRVQAAGRRRFRQLHSLSRPPRTPLSSSVSSRLNKNTITPHHTESKYQNKPARHARTRAYTMSQSHVILLPAMAMCAPSSLALSALHPSILLPPTHP